MKRELIFEKVGDLRTAYPYLYVYFADGSEPKLSGGGPFLAKMKPFMSIEVNQEKQLELHIFHGEDELTLSSEFWREILERAEAFAPEVIADEESYERLYTKTEEGQ